MSLTNCFVKDKRVVSHSASPTISAKRDFGQTVINSTLNKLLQLWHCLLSLRQVEEMMNEGCGFVGHSTVHRWAIKAFPPLAAILRRRERAVGPSWWVDETYIKVVAQWKYTLSGG